MVLGPTKWKPETKRNDLEVPLLAFVPKVPLRSGPPIGEGAEYATGIRHQVLTPWLDNAQRRTSMLTDSA